MSHASGTVSQASGSGGNAPSPPSEMMRDYLTRGPTITEKLASGREPSKEALNSRFAQTVAQANDLARRSMAGDGSISKPKQ